MAELKTKKTDASVDAFIDSVADPLKREDCRTVLALMRRITKTKPAMWGSSIVGFGSYSYRNTTGKTFEWFATGFSPRKESLTLYIMTGFPRHGALMRKLGNHKTGGSCLYLKKLADVDQSVLEELIRESVAWAQSPSPVPSD